MKGYGGLRFDKDGTIVTGPMTIPCGGPFVTFPEIYVQMLHHQLRESDRDITIVRGWRGDLRDRLDHLANDDRGIGRIVEENLVQRPTLVHGDFGQ